MKECPHLTPDNVCEIVSSLAYPYLYSPQESDCKACSRCTRSQEINEITKALSDVVLIQNNLPPLNPHKGPGTRLSYAISWFIAAPPNCNCSNRIETMDLWGLERCIENKSIILSWLRESALDANIPYSEYVISKSLDLLFLSCKLLPIV